MTNGIGMTNRRERGIERKGGFWNDKRERNNKKK